MSASGKSWQKATSAGERYFGGGADGRTRSLAGRCSAKAYFVS